MARQPLEEAAVGGRHACAASQAEHAERARRDRIAEHAGAGEERVAASPFTRIEVGEA